MLKFSTKFNIFCYSIILLGLFIVYLALSKSSRNGYYQLIGKTQQQIKIANITDISATVLQIVPATVALISKNPIIYATQIVSYLIIVPVCQGVKYFVKEPRPDDKNNTRSFPSGHSALAFCGATMAFLALKAQGIKFSFISILCFIIALLTAIGRVLAKRHWNIDIVCGGILGTVSACLAYYIVKYKIQNKN